MISGGLPERFNGADCKSADPPGRVGSNPTPNANDATPVEALTSTGVFNHTAGAMWPKQKDYMLPLCSLQERKTHHGSEPKRV